MSKAALVVLLTVSVSCGCGLSSSLSVMSYEYEGMGPRERGAVRVDLQLGSPREDLLGIKGAALAIDIGYAEHEDEDGVFSRYLSLGIPLVCVGADEGAYTVYKGPHWMLRRPSDWRARGHEVAASTFLLGLTVHGIQRDGDSDVIAVGPSIAYGGAFFANAGGTGIGWIFQFDPAINVETGEFWVGGGIGALIVFGKSSGRVPFRLDPAEL
jgi:hypothetical protein